MEPQFLLAGAILLAAGAVSNAQAQLDLTPRSGVYIGEGTPFPCIRFRDGHVVVRFMQPPGWVFAADGGRCVFHPAGVAQASGSFLAKPRSGEASAPVLEEVRKLLVAGIPAEASALEFTLEGLPGVKLDHWEARHAQCRYEHFGQKFRVALLIVPLEQQDLEIRFSSRAVDFDRLFAPLLESLGTFTWNPTDEAGQDSSEPPPPQR